MSARRAALAMATTLLATVGWLLPAPASATAGAEDTTPATIVLFHGEGCPHCAAEREFLRGVVADRPDIMVEEHEVWNDPAGAELLRRTADRMGFEATGVPVTIIGERVWIGFDDTTAEQITAALDGAAGAEPSTVDLPLLGPVDAASVSLLAATAAIGFVDGINPCSLWVLTLLLAIVVGRGSRGRVLLVGAVFLGVTAGMYALYLLGMYSAASYLSGMGWLRVAVALVAGAFGALQVKDGLGVHAGPSLSISAERRPGLYARMRGLATPSGALGTTLAGTVVLAAAVSLLETPCTAGLPMLWTALLAEQSVGWAQAAGLFAVYMSLFLLDELVVFAAAVLTLRATRVQERHGRALKLVAGSMLLTLAGTMLVAPQALTSLTGTAAVMAAAAVLAACLYALSRRGVSSGPTGSSRSARSSARSSRTTP